MNLTTPAGLLRQYPLISDQVSTAQVETILAQLQKLITDDTDGAVVEFGCYIGTTSLFIRRLLDAYQDTRPFHVYDSFAGLPPKVAQDISPSGTQFQAGELAVSKKQFLQEFHKARLAPPITHKGWFSDFTSDDIPRPIALAFLDGDFYESIRDSLKLVLPNMTPGGIIVFDDYAREALPGVAKAVRDTMPTLADQVQVRHNLGILQL